MDPEAPLQFLVTNLDYSDYVGRIAVGKIVNGSLVMGSRVSLLKKGEEHSKAGLTVVYTYQGLQKVEMEKLEAGDIAAVAGVEEAFIGDTLADPEDPRPLPTITVEEPTMSMEFAVNASPMAGQEGTQVNSRQIKARLEKETLYNVANPGGTGPDRRRLQGERARRASARGPGGDHAPRGFRASAFQTQDHHQRDRRKAHRAFGACGGGRTG